MAKYRDITKEEYEAMRTAMQIHGRHWKRAVRDAWTNGGYHLYNLEAHAQVLQNLRNALGPTWLTNQATVAILKYEAKERERFHAERRQLPAGPVVYRGGSHVVTCDQDGWHRQRMEDGRIVLDCLCSEWVGGCPAKVRKEVCSAGDPHEAHAKKRTKIGDDPDELLGAAPERTA